MSDNNNRDGIPAAPFGVLGFIIGYVGFGLVKWMWKHPIWAGIIILSLYLIGTNG